MSDPAQNRQGMSFGMSFGIGGKNRKPENEKKTPLFSSNSRVFLWCTQQDSNLWPFDS